jgi:hypothetical protein
LKPLKGGLSIEEEKRPMEIISKKYKYKTQEINLRRI